MKGLRAWMAAAAACALCAGARDLVVVHDAGDTVAAGPYVLRAEVSGEEARAAIAAGQARLAAADPRASTMPTAYPLVAGRLRRAGPERRSVRGLLEPVFVIGADGGSLEWLAAEAAKLRESGALGVCVAGTRQAFEAARSLARSMGLDLLPAQGDAIARAYGVATYPVVLEPSP